VTVISLGVGVGYALMATPLYRIQAVLASTETESAAGIPSGLSGLAGLAGISVGGAREGSQSIATLNSRAFIEDFIRDMDLLPILFADEWDAANARWLETDPNEWPNLESGVEYFVSDVRTITEQPDTGLVVLTIDWSDPEVAVSWTEQLIARINDALRERDLADSEARLEYLNEQLASAGLVELRQAISGLIQDQIQTIMLAQAAAEYAFRVIDPPRVPNAPVFPHKRLVVMLAVIIGGMLGLFAALLRSALAHRQLRLAGN
jgi:uncharacterized protein involved in exopolysaccharide biosynthesis